MKNRTEICWNQAQQVSQQVNQEQAVIQQEKITEFLESDCSLFTASDLQHYINATGKDINWIIANGKNINPVLSHAVSMGCTLDELHDINLDVDLESDEHEEPDLKLKDGKITVYFVPIWDDHIFIHVGDEYGQGISYPDEDTQYADLKECHSIPHQQFIDFAINNNIIT